MDTNVIASIKALGLDMIAEAGSGHPGIVLGAAPILYTLYSKHMHISFSDPKWMNRDRFVLSAGHGSALLYATLFMAGFAYTVEDLKRFRKLGSITPGHPEYNVDKGIEATTGPLGQGLAMGIGMALGEKMLADTFTFGKTPKGSTTSLFDYRVYVLCTDGDLMEGISTEAASLAGTLQLDNLIVLYDCNGISLDGKTDMTFTENILQKFAAMQWYTDEVKNGTSVEAIDKAICKAKRSGKPALIKIHTTIGKDSLLQGTNAVHGKPLTEEDMDQIKHKLQVPTAPFHINEQVKENFHNHIMQNTSNIYEAYHERYERYKKENGDSQLQAMEKNYGLDISTLSFQMKEGGKEALRTSNGKIMQTLARHIPYLVGGSADLGSSTMTILEGLGDVKKGNFAGRNVWFGVREHAMGAILNGLSVSHFKVFGSTFLAFADYMKPAIRLSALMKQPVHYIFTHDAVGIGEDGPTHEPIEQLAMLRSTPNLDVFRPCDTKETIGSWRCMLKSSTTPSALILSRQEVPMLENSGVESVARGAYILYGEDENPQIILVATGTDVFTAVHLAEQWKSAKGWRTRVVSMPCKEIYERESTAYKEVLFPRNIHTFVIEAGSSYGWEGIATDADHLITVNHFGASGHKSDVLKYCNFSFEQIKSRIESVLK